MANFYARDRGYRDYHLELPIEKMAQKELQKGEDEIAGLDSIEAIVKQQAVGHISALNRRYKIQTQNQKDNHKLAQANYAVIFQQEQANAQRQFEALQASRGNPGPKQAQGLESLMELAPTLVGMVGDYVEKEKIHRNKTTTNLVLNSGASGAQMSKWAENRELIASNSLEAKIFARHESAKLGVEISPEEMLSIIDLYGERDMAAMTALAHNSARNYPLFLEDPKNQSIEIVLEGGVTKTWGSIRRGRNPAEFAAAQMQMRGHFLEKHQISITDQVPGILDSIGKNIRQIEAQELGRYHAQLNQYNDDAVDSHNDLRWQNSLDEGAPGIESLTQRVAWEQVDTITGKPCHNCAFNDLTDFLERGLKEGTITSANMQDVITANGGRGGQWRTKKLDKLLDEARVQEYNAAQLDKREEQQVQDARKKREIDFFYDPDGQNGSLSMPLKQWEEKMAQSGLSRKSIQEVLSQTLTTGGMKANLVEEKYKAHYDAGQKEAVNSILARVQNNPANQIILGDNENLNDSVGYALLTQRVKMRYHYEFGQLLRTRGAGANDSNIPGISQEAKDKALAWLDENPHYTTLSSPTVTDPVTGDEVHVRNKDRTFPAFSIPTGEKPWVSLAIDKLDDIPGVSPEQRMDGVRDGTYDVVIAREKVLTFYRNGEWDVRAFENSTIGRQLSIRTGIPASEILDIHAEKYGLNRPREDEVLTREELNKHSRGMQQVTLYNSSTSTEVVRAAENPEFRRPASHIGIGGGPGSSLRPVSDVAAVGGSTPNYDNRSFTYTPEHRAFLDMIAFAEGTYDQPNSGYSTKVGFGQFDHMIGHDRVKPAGQISDASGRYQFLSTTWDNVGGGAMTPDAQDWGAMRLALARLGLPQTTQGVQSFMSRLRTEGLSEDIIDALAPEWASMPNLFGPDNKGRVGTRSSFYGQGGKSFSQLQNFYNKVLQHYGMSKGALEV